MDLVPEIYGPTLDQEESVEVNLARETAPSFEPLSPGLDKLVADVNRQMLEIDHPNRGPTFSTSSHYVDSNGGRLSADAVAPLTPERFWVDHCILRTEIVIRVGLIQVPMEAATFSADFHQVMEKRKSAYRSACLLYTSPSPRDATLSRMPSSA